MAGPQRYFYDLQYLYSFGFQFQSGICQRDYGGISYSGPYLKWTSKFASKQEVHCQKSPILLMCMEENPMHQAKKKARKPLILLGLRAIEFWLPY